MRHRKIKDQLLIYFLLFTALPLTIVSFWCFILASRIINEKSDSYAKESIRSLSDNMDQLLLQIETMSLSVAYNNYVQDILEKANTGKEITRLDRFQLEKNIILTYDYGSMRDIAIRHGDRIYRVPGNAEGIPKDYYSPIADSIPSYNVVWNHQPEKGVIQLARKIKSTKDFRTLGILYISVYSGYIDKMVKNINFDQKGFVLVLDEKYVPINVKDVDPAYLAGIGEQMKGESGSFNRRLENVTYRYFYTTSEKTGWKSVGVISVSDLHGQVIRLGSSVMACIFLVSFAAVFLSSWLARSFSAKIHTVTDAMQKASERDFSIQLAEGISQNEFNDLNVGFNRMIQKINSLIQTVYQAELLKKEAEYAALQAQINPHFLYNTLDTICWQAKLKNNEDIFETTYSLSRLLRASMGNKDPFVTVKQELDYVHDYIRIQKARYRQRISASVKVEKEVESVKIPKLILQPIVENAFVHGLEEKGESGVLSVRGILNQEEETVTFVIKDDGVGMTLEQIESVYSQKEKGFGLHSVHKRIQILYGEAYGLKILSEPGRGTTVILRVPIEERQRE